MERSETSFSSIKSRLAALRIQDPGYRIFGSSFHKYRNTPDSKADLERLQNRYSLLLPRDYERFLFEVGYGAGPYYGVKSLFDTESEILACFDSSCEEEAEALANLSLSSPFPTFPVDINDVVDYSRNSFSRAITTDFVADFPCNGCIPICHQGCADYTVLITAGRFRGTVWDIYLEFGGSFWSPAKRPLGLVSKRYTTPQRLPNLPSIPTFREWYIGWLEQCESDLAEKQQTAETFFSKLFKRRN